MANPPPPYANITGISRTVMKDNAQESVTNYNGNARPGEMVVDLTNNNVYIGNTNGNLTLISTGSGSGNSEPAGAVGAVQLNAGGNLFGASANLTFVNNSLTTGNIIPAADNVYFLGNATNRWANVWIGPGTIYITDSNIASNVTAELTVLNGVLQINGADQLQVGQLKFVDNTIESTTGNIAIEIGEIGATADLILSRNTVVTAGKSLTVNGISNLSSNANVKITGGSSGQALTTDGSGNLSWTDVGSSNVTPTYGQFWSNVTQTVASANTEYLFTFNNTDGHNNITLGSGVSNSRIIINKTGLYNIQFSAQIDKAAGSGASSSAYLWFKKNGTAIGNTSGFFTLDNAVQVVQSWNILANVTTAGDYYEIAYAASATNFSFPTIAGNAVIGYPDCPSIILTVTPIGA